MSDDALEGWLAQSQDNVDKHWQLVKEARPEALRLLPRLETAISRLCERDRRAAETAAVPGGGFIPLHQSGGVVVGRSYGRVGFRRQGLLGWIVAVKTHVYMQDPTVIRIDLPQNATVRFFGGRPTMTLRQAAEAGTVENKGAGGSNYQRTEYVHLLFTAAIRGIEATA